MKKLGFLVIALALAFGMSSCGRDGGGAAQGDVIRIAVSMPPILNDFHVAKFRFVEEGIAAAPSNFEFTIFHSTGTDHQVNQLEIIQAQGFDGVIISTLDGVLMAGPAESIYQAGTPTVVINRALETNQFTAFVTGSNVEGGENVARYMGNFLEGQGNIYIMRMAMGTPIDAERNDGFLEVMRTEFPGINIIGYSEGGHTIEFGFEVMQNILAAHPHIDAIYSHDPFSAMGQEQAIINAGRNDVRLIMSAGPSQTIAQHMINNPDTIFRGNFNYPPVMGAEAVRTMVRIFQGETVPQVYSMPAELLMIEDVQVWRHLVP